MAAEPPVGSAPAAQRILITGASRGIGRRLAEHYAGQDHQVFAPTRAECDLRDADQVRLAVERLPAAGLDMIVHCAAINVTRSFRKMDIAAFADMVDVNVLGTVRLLKCALPKLESGGCVILFSSVAAQAPRVGQAAYACCKSALHGLVRALTQELLAEGKYIYLIAPGPVEEGMTQDMMPALSLAAARREVPLRRFCAIGEVIGTIDYLRATPYLTGQTIHLNGGLWLP